MVRGLFRGLALLALAASPAFCDVFLFQGTFGADDQVQKFLFTIASTTTITLQTYGYAGGVVNSTTIAAGGFDPNLALFSPLTPASPILNNGVGCGGATNQDLATGYCEDAYIQEVLSPGTYSVVLMVNDNQPTGGPNDPFLQDGNPGFTCAEYGVGGTFCDVGSGLAESRTGEWALAITGADSAAQVAEPGTVPLVAIGSATIALWTRRRKLFDWRLR